MRRFTVNDGDNDVDNDKDNYNEKEERTSG